MGTRMTGLAVGLATALTAIATVTGATPAAGATPAFVVLAAVGGACVQGIGGSDPLFDGDLVKVVHKRGTKVLARRTVTVASGGFRYCRPPLQPGDRITITHGAATRTITIPAITGRIDPATDLVVANVPPSNRDMRLQWRDMVMGESIGGQDLDRRADVRGHLSKDLTGIVELRNGDWVYVWWDSPQGDAFLRILGSPSLRAKVGDPLVRGSGADGARVTARLRTAGGTTRAIAAGKVGTGAPAFAGKLRSPAGKAVAPRVGDRISLSAIPGKALTLRTGDVAVDPADGGTLTATCPAGGQYLVLRNGELAGAGETPSDGHLSLHPLDLSLDPLPPTTTITLGCETADGLGQRWTTTPS